MRSFLTLSILATALISTYVLTTWSFPQRTFGLQIDPLPALLIVVALRCPISTIGILSIFGSLTQSALSTSSIGATILPLYTLGFIVHMNSQHIAFDNVGTRFILGASAGAFASITSLCILLLSNQQPLFGWFSFWQWIATAGMSGLLALVFYPIVNWLNRSLEEQPLVAPYDTSTRIIRGPHIHG